MTRKLVTDKECDVLEYEFSQWFDKEENSTLFSDCRGLCKSAIMEFLANKVGRTIYSHREDK